MPPALPQPPSLLKDTPLEWMPWYSPLIHRQEVMKWANGDHMREIFQAQPMARELVKTHLSEIEAAIQQELIAAQGPVSQEPSGPARAMSNSNQNAGGVGPTSSGAGGTSEPT